tara:strand:+ start:329 stop:976 length:648 start_codon:yes stop_codon:yes gene_type:complete
MMMANDPYKVYGRQSTDTGVLLGKMLSENPDFAQQYITSVANITKSSDYPIGAIAKGSSAIEKLLNEQILIYLADSIKSRRGEDIVGLYREHDIHDSSIDQSTPYSPVDTAFVAKNWRSKPVDPGHLPSGAIHEALLHGSGGRHVTPEEGTTWWGGRIGADLVNYFYPGRYATRDEVGRSSQRAYDTEERALVESMKEANLYDRYVESLMERIEE